jgi:hypothetical protein
LSHRLIVLSEGRHTATLDAPFSDAEILAKGLPASERAAFAPGASCAQEARSA